MAAESGNTLEQEVLPLGLAPSRWGWLARLGPTSLAFLSVAILATLSWLDIWTFPGVSISYWFSLPAIIMAWFVGRRAGIAMALVSIVWKLALERVISTREFHWANSIVSAANRLIFLLWTVVMLSNFRELHLRLESIVLERTQSLRRLAAKLSNAEEEERRRIAGDIHDGLGQVLTLLKLNLARARSEATPDSSTDQRIRDAIGSVDELIGHTRSLTFDLHPAMLDHLGLAPTLQRYVEQFKQQTNIEVTVSEDGSPIALSPTLANYLFRSVKELLNNAARHGNAKQIVVAVHYDRNRVRLVVDDDGVGFDAEKTLNDPTRKGLGLAAIRERLISLGGNYRIESTPGQGTRVVLDVDVTQTDSKA